MMPASAGFGARQPRGARAGAGLHEEPFGLQAAVEIGNKLAVAIEKLRRDAVVLADDPFTRLAPARMRDLRVDVGPEAVFARLDLLPERDRPLIGELEKDDGLD